MRRFLFAAIGLIGGLALLTVTPNFFTDFLRGSSDIDPSQVLATLEAISGPVFIKTPKELHYQEARIQQPLAHFFRIRTDNSGEALIGMGSGHQIKLLENSEAVIEKAKKSPHNRTVIFHLVHGRYETTESGNESDLLISFDGHITNDQTHPTYELSTKLSTSTAREKKMSEPFVKPNSSKARPQISKITQIDLQTDTLSNKYIFSVINNQRSHFKNCYMQHLRTKPSSTGSMKLSFTISSRGKVTQTRVIETTIADRTMQKCIRTVLSRCRFRSFESSPIIAQYPISFE